MTHPPDPLPAEAFPLKVVVERGMVVSVADSNGDELEEGLVEIVDRDVEKDGP